MPNFKSKHERQKPKIKTQNVQNIMEFYYGNMKKTKHVYGVRLYPTNVE
jgi:hypothetical protein